MKTEMNKDNQYGTVVRGGITYYRTRITDADGKRAVIYARTPEELEKKRKDAVLAVEDAKFRDEHPTVSEYCEKWLTMKSATVRPTTVRNYRKAMDKHIVGPLGDLYMCDVTADDIRLALVPVSRLSSSMYNTINMLIKCIFYSAERSGLIDYNPAAGISPKGGKSPKSIQPLTDEQVSRLIETVRELPPYVFVMLGVYAGLRREEILALKWDSVFLDGSTPYISVRRSWYSEKNRPVITTRLKTPAARRDIPIPKCLADCLRNHKERSISEFVIADSDGEPLSYSQFDRVWKYIKVRTAQPRIYYHYLNGQKIRKVISPSLGEHQKNCPRVVYSLDFKVTPHQLRHTYITNLIHAGVDPKTVQYLAGHENSKTTMDIYASVKYNRPEELSGVVNEAFNTQCAVDTFAVV